MYSRVQTSALIGIETVPVFVEVDVSPGLPVFEIVGNVSLQVKEGRERIKTALHNIGVLLPAKRITVNLSPSNIRKDSASFDIPIAVAILCALGIVDGDTIKNTLFVGELNLGGDVLPVNGVLPIVSDGIKRGLTNFVVPQMNLKEAKLVSKANVFGFSCLSDLLKFLNGQVYVEIDENQGVKQRRKIPDFSEVNGQMFVRRAAEIAAAGMHNLLLIGPPGAGKTMVAERMPGILPSLTDEEKMEISKIYSIKGMLSGNAGLLEERPFRNPHHTISKVGMTGGGSSLTPGEISLAHTGVLFLDELTEFDKSTIEILRQPMEDKSVRITRAAGNVEYPSDFLLLAAMNPCNCGYYPDMQLCRCTPSQRRRYLGKLSQPLLDRIDLFVKAEILSFGDLNYSHINESSAEIKERVTDCQNIQLKRFEKLNIFHNSQIPANLMKEFCALSKNDEAFMEEAFNQFRMTGRTYHKLLRVARTIADLDASINIERKHIEEALLFRNPEEFEMVEVVV